MADLFKMHGIDYKKPDSNLKKIGDALGGAGVGLAQGLSDMGANIAQAPGDLYTWATGKPSYTSPKPDIRGYSPSSEAGSWGEVAGEYAAPLASPGVGLEALLGKAMFGGRLLPRIATQAGIGAAESDDRALGAAAGALTPALTRIAQQPLTKRGASRKLNKASKLGADIESLPVSDETAGGLQYLFESPELRPAKPQLSALLEAASSGGYAPYRELQSGLKDVSRELRYGKEPDGFMKKLMGMFSPPQSTAADRLTADQLDKLIAKHKGEVHQYLQGIKRGDLAALENEGNLDYRRYMEWNPLIKKAAVGSAAGYLGVPYLKHLMY